jgi:preprotein translocase SecE subunit
MLSMYKPGQGYWTRMMSAIFFGVLVAGGALWLSSQIGAMNIAPAAWRYTVSSTEGFTSGAEVELRRSGTEVGSGFVRRTDGDVVELTNVAIASDTPATGIQTMVVDGSTPVEVSSLQIVPQFEKTYLQGGVAAGTLLLGAIIIFWFCYANKKSSEFLIATEGEMKKVNWSNRREVLGSTWVVIGISVIIAAILFTADIIFRYLAVQIDLIQT